MNPYAEDEWHDEEEELERWYEENTMFIDYLEKSPKGRLYILEITLINDYHWGWGCDETYERKINLNRLLPEYKALAIEYGKTMTSGQSIEFDDIFKDYEYEEDEE